MKKFISVLCSAALTAALAVSASASDYYIPPLYPVETPISSVVEAVIEAITSGDPISAADFGTVISKDVLAEIAKSDVPVTFEADGYDVTIDPALITDSVPDNFDFTMEIASGAAAAAEFVPSNVKLPSNVFSIAPVMHGAFGFTLNLAFPVTALEAAGINPARARVFYIDDNGGVEDLGRVTVKGGKVSFGINHASAYVIAEEAPVSVDVPEDGEEIDVGTDTGVGNTDEIDSGDVIGGGKDPADSGSAASPSGESNPATGVTVAVGALLASGLVAIVSRKSKK